MTDPLNASHPIIAREGRWHIVLSLLVAVLATYWFGWWSLPFWLVAVFVLQFFRDPIRVSPRQAGAVLSAADGRVVYVGPATDPYLDRPALKISVFMNVFSVHSNRAPVPGKVTRLWYHRGRFINAALDKASEQNERNALCIRESEKGRDIVVVQIAGLIARRILCYVKEGDELDWGQRFGFIRFGSRVDHYMPEDFGAKVELGDTVTAGIDIVAIDPR